MLFMQPAVVQQDGPVQDPVAEVRTVPKPVKTGVPTWKAEGLMAQATGLGSGATPGAPVPEPPRANIAPGAGSTNNPFGSSTNPVGAQPVIPNQPGANPTTTPGGNTYGTQQEGTTTPAAPTAPIAPTAPVSPGVPGPGAGTGGGGGGLAAPPLATPPAGNVDTGSSSYQNLSSPYNSTGSGAGTGTGMGTTATPPSAGTTAAPPIPAPTTSGASSTP